MVLLWQELGAPQLIWVNLLAIAALLCLIPAQPARTSMARLRFWLQLYQRGSLLLLAVLLLPFLVEDVRTGLYPQLGPSESGFGEELGLTVLDSMEGPAQKMPMETDLAMGKSLKAPLAVARRQPVLVAPAPVRPLPVMDPDTQVQTGPGVPVWRWRSWELAWNGPIPQGHRIDLWLLTLGADLALTLVRLVLVLSLKLAGLSGAVFKRTPDVALVLLIAGWFRPTAPASAQGLPFPELLEALKTRLLKPLIASRPAPISPS